jgi:hypothetical protein
MATYKDVQWEVKLRAGFVPKTCWIAHVLELLGTKLRQAPNRIHPEERRHPCPSERRLVIIAAFYKLGGAEAMGTGLVRSAL